MSCHLHRSRHSQQQTQRCYSCRQSDRQRPPLFNSIPLLNSLSNWLPLNLTQSYCSTLEMAASQPNPTQSHCSTRSPRRCYSSQPYFVARFNPADQLDTQYNAVIQFSFSTLLAASTAAAKLNSIPLFNSIALLSSLFKSLFKSLPLKAISTA